MRLISPIGSERLGNRAIFGTVPHAPVAHPVTHENGRSSILALPSHRVEATNFCHELSQSKFVLIHAHTSWPIFEAGCSLFCHRRGVRSIMSLQSVHIHSQRQAVFSAIIFCSRGEASKRTASLLGAVGAVQIRLWSNLLMLLGGKQNMDDELRQQVKDEEQLRLLSLGYMISAGVTAVFSFFGLIYVFMGLMFSFVFRHVPNAKPEEAPPEFFGWLMVIMGGAFLVFGITIAILKWQAARCLKQRRSLTFCRVIAGITCLGMPYGTALGVLTFIALGRPSLRRLFDAQ
jgi:hypothetical protein